MQSIASWETKIELCHDVNKQDTALFSSTSLKAQKCNTAVAQMLCMREARQGFKRTSRSLSLRLWNAGDGRSSVCLRGLPERGRTSVTCVMLASILVAPQVGCL